MTAKEKYVESLNNVDPTEEDWEYDIVEAIENDYARGYITCKIDIFGGTTMTPKEKQEEMLEFADYSIWD